MVTSVPPTDPRHQGWPSQRASEARGDNPAWRSMKTSRTPFDADIDETEERLARASIERCLQERILFRTRDPLAASIATTALMAAMSEERVAGVRRTSLAIVREGWLRGRRQ